MIRSIITAAAVMGLAGCELMPGTRQHGQNAFLEAVKAELDGTLFNYSTARFREVRMTQGGDCICGEVNSKNRMGAYVGWQPFSAVQNPEGGPPIIDVRFSAGSARSYGAIMCSVVKERQELEDRDLSDRMTYRP